MFKLVVLCLVVMLGWVRAEPDDAQHLTQLTGHMAKLLSQVTHQVDGLQERMDQMEKAVKGRIEELQKRTNEKFDKLEMTIASGHGGGKDCCYEEASDFRKCINKPEWTVIQRRVSGKVDFNLNWENYKRGFGDPEGSMWLGLDKIHKLCSNNCQLYVLMAKETNCTDLDTAYALYDKFNIADESDNYRMTVGGYSGTAGDSLIHHNGVQFSTYEKDNDLWKGNCAQSIGGFWFTKCLAVNPNGQYFTGPPPHRRVYGILWRDYTGFEFSLKFIEMRVKPTA